MRRRWGWVFVVGFAGLGMATHGDEPSLGREIPPALAPFEYLIGAWKGTGVPTANRVRGWDERHAWAWSFTKGVPTGLTVELTGDKVLAKGQLTHDPATRRYTLVGTTPDRKPVRFSGALDAAGKSLVLEREGAGPEGASQRLTLYPNSNQVRYTIRVEEREAGAPQFRRTLEIGVTKEGEAFAAGGAAADLPKCIVTGGAATMTVSYKGASYPLCCTGCRDEFNENPEKYLKKISLLKATAKDAKPATSPVMKDDGAFDGLADEPKAAAKAKTKSAAKPSAAEKPAAPESAPAPKAADAAARASSLLKLGQNLEKSGRTAAALGYYRRVVKEYPDTPAAKTAAERVKVLGGT